MKKRILIIIFALMQCVPQVVYAGEIEESIIESYENDIPGLTAINTDSKTELIQELESLTESDRRTAIRELNSMFGDQISKNTYNHWNKWEKQAFHKINNNLATYYDTGDFEAYWKTYPAHDFLGAAKVDIQHATDSIKDDADDVRRVVEAGAKLREEEESKSSTPAPSNPSSGNDQNDNNTNPGNGNQNHGSNTGTNPGYGNQTSTGNFSDEDALQYFAIAAKGQKSTGATSLGSKEPIPYKETEITDTTTLNTFKTNHGISDEAFIQSMLMNIEPWDGSSKLVKNIATKEDEGRNKLIEVLKDMLDGDDSSDIEFDTKEIEEEVKHTDNTSVDDFALTSYARISGLYAKTKGRESPSGKIYSDFDKQRKSITWVTNSFQILDGTPIMLDDTYFKQSLADDLGYLAKLNVAVAEYGSYATSWREKHKDGELDDDAKKALEVMNKTVETYRGVIPALQTAWEYGSPSLKDLYNGNKDEDGEDDVLGNGLDDQDALGVDHPQPLTTFFEINTLGTNVAGVNDPWKWFNQESIETPGIILTDYIKTGIAESASYVPMMTNVYTRDVLNEMDDTDFKQNFHYKYGFMRKALYIENSSTSVESFWSTKGKNVGQKKICTLGDLLDFAKDNREVTLWVDDNFYNADQLQESIQKISSEQHDRIEKSVAYGTTAYQGQKGMLSAIGDAVTDFVGGDGGTSNAAEEIQTANGTQNATKEYALDQFLMYSGLTNLDTSKDSDLLEVVNSLAKMAGSTIQTDDVALKNGDFTSYSSSLRSDLTAESEKNLVGGDYTDADVPTFDINNPDNYVMTSYDIKRILSGTTTREEDSLSDNKIGYRYTTYNAYTPLLSYAYVSAVYRDKSAFSLLENCSSYSPVFMASEKMTPTVLQDPNLSKILQNSIYNYALLKNLSSMAQISYTYTLDLRSPLYIDIYGNILTSSGTVVIPAAANATLWGEDWASTQPAIGLYSCYGKEYAIPASVETSQLEYKWSTENNNVWMPMGREVSSSEATGVIDYSNLNSYDKASQEIAKLNMYQYLSDDSKINWWAYAGIISEVMRGAPIDSIDVIKEGLIDESKDVDGLVLASKLESLEASLNNSMKQNSLFIMPDFTRMDNVEYFMLFVIKILAILTVFVVLVIIYQDGAANMIGLRTLFKTMFAVFLTFMSITMVPAIFQLTYYGANRLLLQSEADRIIMFRTEKYNSGVEVGVTETTVPTNNNDIMIRLDFIDVPWYDYISQIVFASSVTNISEVRLKRMSESLVAQQPDVQVYNDGVYMSVNDILNSIRMDYTFGEDVWVASTEGEAMNTNLGDGNDKNIYLQNTNEYQTFSYYSPYYAFLRTIVTNINDYNSLTGEYSYVTKYMSGTRPKTVGLCENYFLSPTFMEDGVDIFRLHEIYQNTPSKYVEVKDGRLMLVPAINPFDDEVFSEDDITKMKQSLWYSYGDEQTLDARMKAMDKWARDYISRNQNVISKISDETFIKVFCLSAALKYNQIYGVSEANVYEIYNIDSNDLLRLAVSTQDNAMQASPMSYARYLFTYGGEAAVYVGAMLAMVLWLGSVLKPLCTIIVFLSVFVSIFVNKIILRKTGGFMGYVYTTLIISSVNIAHAIMLKLSCMIPSFGFPTFVCAILVMLTQILYLAALAMITWTSLREWRDMGEEHYRSQVQKLKWQKKGYGAQALQTNVAYHKDNKEYYNDLLRTYRKRQGAPYDSDDFT